MNTFFKLVGGIAVGVIVLSVLYGILHVLISFAVAGVFLVIFGVVCLLAVVGIGAWSGRAELSLRKAAIREN